MESQQQIQGDVAYIKGILQGLYEHFLDGTPVAGSPEELPLNTVLLGTLCRAVMSEGYGL